MHLWWIKQRYILKKWLIGGIFLQVIINQIYFCCCHKLRVIYKHSFGRLASSVFVVTRRYNTQRLFILFLKKFKFYLHCLNIWEEFFNFIFFFVFWTRRMLSFKVFLQTMAIHKLHTIKNFYCEFTGRATNCTRS